eukprot:8379258-Heterocapsa_arctica.AAC.1
MSHTGSGNGSLHAYPTVWRGNGGRKDVEHPACSLAEAGPSLHTLWNIERRRSGAAHGRLGTAASK